MLDRETVSLAPDVRGRIVERLKETQGVLTPEDLHEVGTDWPNSYEAVDVFEEAAPPIFDRVDTPTLSKKLVENTTFIPTIHLTATDGEIASNHIHVVAKNLRDSGGKPVVWLEMGSLGEWNNMEGLFNVPQDKKDLAIKQFMMMVLRYRTRFADMWNTNPLLSFGDDQDHWEQYGKDSFSDPIKKVLEEEHIPHVLELPPSVETIRLSLLERLAYFKLEKDARSSHSLEAYLHSQLIQIESGVGASVAREFTLISQLESLVEQGNQPIVIIGQNHVEALQGSSAGEIKVVGQILTSFDPTDEIKNYFRQGEIPLAETVQRLILEAYAMEIIQEWLYDRWVGWRDKTSISADARKISSRWTDDQIKELYGKYSFVDKRFMNPVHGIEAWVKQNGTTEEKSLPLQSSSYWSQYLPQLGASAETETSKP